MTTGMHQKNFACLLAFIFIFLYGCEKKLSFYYPDKETPGAAIFSNTGNNVFSCFVNGRPWRTIESSYGGFLSQSTYEVTITIRKNFGLQDTISINWLGSYNDQNTQNNGLWEICLNLPVPSNVSLTGLSSLQGKRLAIDSTNGYFSFGTRGPQRGSGNIYFNTIHFDSTAPYGYHGKISGLLEATIDSFKITSGRFDDIINQQQVQNY